MEQYAQIGLPLEEHYPQEIRSSDGVLETALEMDAWYSGFEDRIEVLGAVGPERPQDCNMSHV